MKELATLARRRKRQSYHIERNKFSIRNWTLNGKSQRRRSLESVIMTVSSSSSSSSSSLLLSKNDKRDGFPLEKNEMKRVDVSESTMDAFHQEFRTLTLPMSVECLATHWKSSRLIQMCHDDDEQEEGETIRTKKEVAELLNRATQSSIAINCNSSRRHLELREALHQLVTATGSLPERVTCLEDAQNILSCVVTLTNKK